MLKQLVTYVFIFILSVSVVFGNSSESILPEQAVNTAFIESEAKLDHININSYVIFNNEFIAIDKANHICDDISEKLGMKSVSITRDSREDYSQITVNGILDEELYGTIILQSSKLQDFKESNIVINIIETREQYDLEKICGKIRNVLESYGEVNLNITLSGYYEGFVDNENLEENINRIFRKLGAKKVEGIKEKELVSITGYASSINEYISYIGKKANINVAARYNSYENKTYIWIGTPLIVLEY